MNHDAQIILMQLESRKALLSSLEPSGLFVHEGIAGLCYGKVCGVDALVPVEHATTYTQRDLQVARRRGFPMIDMRSMAELVGEELLRIDAEFAWVLECGTGAT